MARRYMQRASGRHQHIAPNAAIISPSWWRNFASPLPTRVCARSFAASSVCLVKPRLPSEGRAAPWTGRAAHGASARYAALHAAIWRQAWRGRLALPFIGTAYERGAGALLALHATVRRRHKTRGGISRRGPKSSARAAFAPTSGAAFPSLLQRRLCWHASGAAWRGTYGRLDCCARTERRRLATRRVALERGAISLNTHLRRA